MNVKRLVITFLVGISVRGAHAFISDASDVALRSLIERSVPLTEATRKKLALSEQTMAHYDSSVVAHDGGIPLYHAYPRLQAVLPRKALCALPTPIDQLEQLGRMLGLAQLYCKRDDLTGGFDAQGHPLYGGNKIRKLEFLLADAHAQGARHIITIGCAGSNHATATAFWVGNASPVAGDFDRCTLFLKPQHNAFGVQYNLLMDQQSGAELVACSSNEDRADKIVDFCAAWRAEHGQYPYCIPTGGSTPLGAVGFVNAAFELRDQIQRGVMPEPDVLYVALGSAGTVAGLILGCKAAGLKTIVKAVAVEPEDEAVWRLKVDNLLNETNVLLHTADSQFPLFKLGEFRYDVVTTACGSDYGLITPEAAMARDLVFEQENLRLDGTYTAKACVGIMDDLMALRAKNAVVLFWNTFSQPVVDYAQFKRELAAIKHPSDLALPEMLRRYFDEPVQVLDRLIV